MSREKKQIMQRYVSLLTNSGFKAVFGDRANKDVVMSVINILLPEGKQVGYGKLLNTRIAYKRPQIGSSVKRRSDGAILEVINISMDHKFKCYDFAKDDCYIYTRDELMLS